MVTMVQAPRTARVTRRPGHTFLLKQSPFQITPFLIAPVLPGETVKSIVMQSRVVTDPIKSPLAGWWLQYHVFYVKHRDLGDRDALVNMALDPAGGSLTALNNVAHVPTYHYGGAPNFTVKCLQRVVEEYFRDEGESWTSPNTGDSVSPFAQIATNDWTDSVKPAASIVGTDLDPTNTDDVTTLQLENAMRAWEWYRAQGVTSMDYEDYLRTFGVSMPKQEMHRPELIRSWSEWQYPSNTVDPVTGAPSSAVSWGFAGRADKDIYCKEPGWIFGVSVVKPKIFKSKLKGSAASLMNNALLWFPAVMMDDPYTSLVTIPDNTGPIGDVTDAGGHWVDVRDLLLYGDQFVNFAMTGGEDSCMNVPGPSLSGNDLRYPTKTMVDLLFKNPAAVSIRTDGIANLTILGTQQDNTPRYRGMSGGN